MGTTRKDVETAITWASETGRKVVSVEFAKDDGAGIKSVHDIKCAVVDGVGLSRAVLDTGSHMHLDGLAERYALKTGKAEPVTAEADEVE